MGGDDSQKLLPWREIRSPPGRSKPPAHCRINTVTETAVGISRAPPSPASLAMASATASLGHFWKAQVGQFWRAPKVSTKFGRETGRETRETGRETGQPPITQFPGRSGAVAQTG